MSNQNLESVKTVHYTHARFYSENELYVNQDSNYFFGTPQEANVVANLRNEQNKDVPGVQESPFVVVQVTKTTVIKKV